MEHPDRDIREGDDQDFELEADPESAEGEFIPEE